jgi:hypothetical protein
VGSCLLECYSLFSGWPLDFLHVSRFIPGLRILVLQLGYSQRLALFVTTVGLSKGCCAHHGHILQDEVKG